MNMIESRAVHLNYFVDSNESIKAEKFTLTIPIQRKFLMKISINYYEKQTHI